MKKVFVIVLMTVVLGITASAQKMEVLYFKADLACCRAKACDDMESVLRSIIENKFKEDNITFTSVRISDTGNKELVKKFNAGSQTVVLVTTRGNNQTSTDLSDVVKTYSRSRNKVVFEQDVLARITENIK